MLMLGLNPGQHGLIDAAATVTSTGPSPLRHQLPHSLHMSSTPAVHSFQWHHPQTSHLSYSTGSDSLEVSVVAPDTPAPAGIDLNAMPMGH